jgi:membrane-bound inhibitor of C-type lysozyme
LACLQSKESDMPKVVPIALAMSPFVLLAACGGQETAEPAAEATTAAAVATPAAAAPIVYDCLPAQRLSAVYDNTGPTSLATLTLDGATYQLTSVPTGSGARYVTESGRSPGKTLVWWTKGPDGTLYEGEVGGAEGAETKLAECSESVATG